MIGLLPYYRFTEMPCGRQRCDSLNETLQVRLGDDVDAVVDRDNEIELAGESDYDP